MKKLILILAIFCASCATNVQYEKTCTINNNGKETCIEKFNSSGVSPYINYIPYIPEYRYNSRYYRY